MNVGSEPDDRFLDAVDDLEFERRARVVMPDLDRVDAVPVRAFAAGEQEQDRGRRRSAADQTRVAEGLAIVAALRVRLQRELGDHLGGGGVGHGQNLFFLARTSAKTSTAGFPAIPTLAATSARSARRNGLASFSSPMVVGIVA